MRTWRCESKTGSKWKELSYINNSSSILIFIMPLLYGFVRLLIKQLGLVPLVSSHESTIKESLN